MSSDYVVILGQAPPAAPTATTAQPADPGILPQAPPMAGLPGGPIGGGLTVSLLFASMIVGFIAVKVYKAKLSSMVLGVCIGVLGAGGFIGALAWTLIGIAYKAVMSIAGAFG